MATPSFDPNLHSLWFLLRLRYLRLSVVTISVYISTICHLRRLPIIAGSDLNHLSYRTCRGSTLSSSLGVICQAALSVFRNLEVHTSESRDMLSLCLKTRHCCWIFFLCHHPLFQI